MIGLATAAALPYLALNLVVLGRCAWEVIALPSLFGNWSGALALKKESKWKRLITESLVPCECQVNSRSFKIDGHESLQGLRDSATGMLAVESDRTFHVEQHFRSRWSATSGDCSTITDKPEVVQRRTMDRIGASLGRARREDPPKSGRGSLLPNSARALNLLEARFRPTRSRPTTYPVSHLIGCKPISVYASSTKIAA